MRPHLHAVPSVVSSQAFSPRWQEWWERAAAFDPRLRCGARDLTALGKARLRPIPYDRGVLFGRMAANRVTVVEGARVRLRGDHGGREGRAAFLDLLRASFATTDRARVQAGREARRSALGIAEVIRRWERDDSILGVTDLHFRDTELERAADVRPLSGFNLLLAGPASVRFLEMMTLVVATTGNVTDSHTDDADGSNHCFCGMKLWLTWDRLEGQKRGLQDVSHDTVHDWARFDLRTFLTVPGARWFLVQPGQTLFLPGDRAHRVITLEAYLGLGSFHVSLPGYPETLRRWLLDDPTDVTPRVRTAIHGTVLRAIHRSRTSRHERSRWGADHLAAALSSWRRRTAPAIVRRVEGAREYGSLLAAVGR